jgi:Tol biopolymer transport system component
MVPFDLAKLSKATTWVQLQDMGGCFTYGNLSNQGPSKSARWSNDSKKIAVDTQSPVAGIRVDLILIFDVSTCNNVSPRFLDNFPGSRFTMIGYDKNPVIPSFDWDGQSLFLLNSIFRYQFGYLYAYNTETKRTADLLDPLGTSCCYSDARWSPDGSYVFFAYQAIGGNTQLYYISFGNIDTGVKYTPFDLPADILSKPGDHPDAALRPTQ